jgi:hypothetical protein
MPPETPLSRCGAGFTPRYCQVEQRSTAAKRHGTIHNANPGQRDIAAISDGYFVLWRSMTIKERWAACIVGFEPLRPAINGYRFFETKRWRCAKIMRLIRVGQAG